MDHLSRSGSRHTPPPTGKQPLPRLIRSRSENPPTSPTKSRSKSTTKTRSYREQEVNKLTIHIPSPMTTINTGLTSPATKKKAITLPRKKPTSPSAWALSPGRVAPFPTPIQAKAPSPASKTGGERTSGGGISGVLKYFRQRKTTSLEEADHHSFKVMNNRLLQWRFANARAEATMSTVKTVAERKVFNAWLKILAIQNSNMSKQMEIQKLKNNIKLYHIMNSQLFLLEKWSRMEAKNFEAVGRMVRKLSVASINIPLVHDCKGDVLEVSNVLDTATILLEDIESTISASSYQAEKSCYLLTELSIIAKQEKESLAELQTWMTVVESLKEKERSLRAHLIQAY
uniref:QWRF motif-containing protein 7 n=1 Tax=Erigeron canadensis TaxID=72917 RepID=UPI001CB99147|nr:QWRF motif-containing protein 7 [Erigeron canadensis]